MFWFDNEKYEGRLTILICVVICYSVLNLSICYKKCFLKLATCVYHAVPIYNIRFYKSVNLHVYLLKNGKMWKSTTTVHLFY